MGKPIKKTDFGKLSDFDDFKREIPTQEKPHRLAFVRKMLNAII
jgi:hypothetical protein